MATITIFLLQGSPTAPSRVAHEKQMERSPTVGGNVLVLLLFELEPYILHSEQHANHPSHSLGGNSYYYWMEPYSSGGTHSYNRLARRGNTAVL